MILALVNNKGGVAKTTTAVSLAAGIAATKRRCLLIDLDSQGSASLSLGVPRSDLSPSVAEVLFDDVPVRQAIRRTVVESLDLLTGSMALANADLVLADMRGRERRLKDAIAPARDDYAFVVLDCPPSLSLLPINALVAADAFIVPVVPHYLALEGLVNLMDAVARLKDGIGVAAELLGLVLTMVDYRTNAAGELVAMIRDHYRRAVFKTEIRTNVRLTEAPSFGKTIFDYAPTSSGAVAYAELTAEVLQRCRKATH